MYVAERRHPMKSLRAEKQDPGQPQKKTGGTREKRAAPVYPGPQDGSSPLTAPVSRAGAALDRLFRGFDARLAGYGEYFLNPARYGYLCATRDLSRRPVRSGIVMTIHTAPPAVPTRKALHQTG